jgi:hypothetical protein
MRGAPQLVPYTVFELRIPSADQNRAGGFGWLPDRHSWPEILDDGVHAVSDGLEKVLNVRRGARFGFVQHVPVLAEMHIRSDFSPERRWSTMTTFVPADREKGESGDSLCRILSSVG